MDRRKFLRQAAAFSLPIVTGIPGVRAAGTSLFTSLLPPNTDRVLVLIQLNGGNDGLNTLIPLNQLSELQTVRPHVYQPDTNLRAITASLALHSRMEDMQQLFNNGKLGIVQDVGYPNQNRSHFRSGDIWTTASDATTIRETGWLGRTLEYDFPGYPNNYPNSDLPHPAAITLGPTANNTCQGTLTNLSQAVQNPTSLIALASGGNTPLPNDNYGEELGFLRTAITQTNEYGLSIQTAARMGSSSATYPDNPLGRSLRNVALLISGGLETQVYIVQHNGYDTHSNQVDPNNTENGRHADLLDTLSVGITAFQEDIDQLGLSDRVLGMTFSEFGRRIRSNGSNGTDHGTAAPMFLFGSCAGGTVLGENPEIDTAVDQNTGVPLQYDFRDVYGSVMQDWFGVAEARVREVLYPNYVYLPVATSCARALPVTLFEFTATGQEKHIILNWQTTQEADNAGFEVERSQDGQTFHRIGWVAAAGANQEGIRSYEFNDVNVSRGPLYYYRLRQQDLSGASELSPIRTARLRGSAIGEISVGFPYPNPAVKMTTVQAYLPTDGRLTYTLFSQNGQRILTDSTIIVGRRDTQIEISVSRVPAGMYTLRFTADQGKTITRKLIVR